MARSNDLLDGGSEHDHELDAEPRSQTADEEASEYAPRWSRSMAPSLLQRSALSHSVNAGVRASALRHAQQMLGNRAARMHVGWMQAKLAVSEPGDPLEQQADEVAEAIVNPAACACGGTCAHCQQTGSAQRSALSAGGEIANPLGTDLPAVPGPGMPLDADVRAPMEEHFGRGFEGVRVHTGTEAAEAAGAVDARAYTMGQDIVFGHGEFNPGTSEGRHLLAHELTHVVQQGSSGVKPQIQRRLMMTGAKKDIDVALGMLEPPSDLDLKHDAKTTRVSVNKDGGKPASPELARRLKQIVNDAAQHAQVHFGRKQEGVFVGAFPADPGKPVQEVRIDHVLALEKGAPGSGVSKLAHEIVENYEAFAHKDTLDWSMAFEVAHGSAIETEDLVQKELGHPGARRNSFAVYIDPPGKTPSFNRRIEDRGSHFVVVDQSLDGTSKLSNARRVGRLAVSKYKIDGFSAGSASLPKTAAAEIASLARDMKDNPTASAYVEGFASSEGTPEKNIGLAQKRSDAVAEAVIAAVDDVLNTNWRRFEHVGHAAKKWNTVVITVERPDL